MAKYEVVAVNRVTQQEVRRYFLKAPPNEWVANWLLDRAQRGQDPPDTRAVGQWVATRYYPSKKGWMILDFEHASPRPLYSRGGVTVWAGIRRGTKVYPSEAAALMKISYLIAMPEQLALVL